MKSSERGEHGRLTRSDRDGSEMKRRKTVSLNAIVANNAFSEGRGNPAGARRREEGASERATGSEKKGPRPRGDFVEDKPVIEIEDDDDVFPDEDPDPAATVRERCPRLTPRRVSIPVDTPSRLP